MKGEQEAAAESLPRGCPPTPHPPGQTPLSAAFKSQEISDSVHPLNQDHRVLQTGLTLSFIFSSENLNLVSKT